MRASRECTWPLAGAKEQHAASCSQQVLSGSRASGVKNADRADESVAV